MNDDYSFYSSRRRFIRRTGSLVALGSLPAYLHADTTAFNAGVNSMLRQQGLVLFREEDAHSAAFAATMAEAGLETVALSDDLVRQWRDSLGDLVGRQSMTVIGLTNWADYLLINELSREQRKHVMLEIQHQMAKSSAINGAATLAAGYLHLPFTADRETLADFAREVVGNPPLQAGQRTLFSWLIA